MIYNSVDLSTYGLKARLKSPASFMPPIRSSMIEVGDRAYDFQAFTGPRSIELDAYVTGTSEANLISNLDNISLILNPLNGLKALVLDFPDDRYYNAKISNSIEWEITHHKLAQATIVFICPDPKGYANTATSSNFNIDADPDTVQEVVGGTTWVLPTFTLTAGEALNAVTILIENTDTAEELSWVGSLANGEVLVINSETFYVTKQGAASMATVTGVFPRLKAGITNDIKVTGFSTTGTLNISYRASYL